MVDFDSKALELARDAQMRVANASEDRMPRDRQTSIIQCAIIEGMKWAAPRAPWPAGCIKKSSCARNRTCAYGCQHQSRDIRDEVDAAIAASPHPIVAEGVEADDEAASLWRWIEGYMVMECNHTPEYMSEANRSTITNAIRAALAREAPAVEPCEADSDLRCKATGHLCGTDTWEVGRPCRCESCQEYIAREAPR